MKKASIGELHTNKDALSKGKGFSVIHLVKKLGFEEPWPVVHSITSEKGTIKT